MAAHPTQNDVGVFERPQYGQLYFLDPDEAVNERVNHPLNSGITTSMMKLLEFIVRAQNRYAQGYIMMREVEDEMNRLTSAQGLPFRLSNEIYIMNPTNDSQMTNSWLPFARFSDPFKIFRHLPIKMILT